MTFRHSQFADKPEIARAALRLFRPTNPARKQSVFGDVASRKFTARVSTVGFRLVWFQPAGSETDDGCDHDCERDPGYRGLWPEQAPAGFAAADGEQPEVSFEELTLQGVGGEVQQAAGEQTDKDGMSQAAIGEELRDQPARNRVGNWCVQGHDEVVRAGNQNVERSRQQVWQKNAGQKDQAQRRSLSQWDQQERSRNQRRPNPTTAPSEAVSTSSPEPMTLPATTTPGPR